MKISPIIVISISVMIICAIQAQSGQNISITRTKGIIRSLDKDPDISRYLRGLAHRACSRFKDSGLKPDGIGMSLILDGGKPAIGGYRMDEGFYPASVIKLAWAVALECSWASGRLQRDASSEEDLKLMLRDSSNTASHRVVDALTGTVSGDRLTDEELALFLKARRHTDSLMKSYGLKNIRAAQKTWDASLSPRDQQFLGPNGENRNSISPADACTLLWLIKNGNIVSVDACDEILEHLRRRPGNEKDFQACRIGAGTPKSARMWSKAGWTDDSNNDVAYIEAPLTDGYCLAVFTNTSWENGEILKWIGSEVNSAIVLNRIRPQKQINIPPRILSFPAAQNGN